MNQLGLFDAPPKHPTQPIGMPALKQGGRTEVCYRNPDDPMQAWTGRGKPPRWVTDWMQCGKSLEALRVPGTRP